MEIVHRPADFRRAGKETQHMAIGRADRVGSSLGDRLRRCIRNVDRMDAPGHGDDRAAVEKRGDRLRLDRGRHHDDPEIVARPPRLSRQGDGKVGVDAALVKLVEDDRREI
jgi:hypothetical protein